MLPPVLAMAILIAGMSANMSSGSSDAIAAVSIMLRDLYTGDRPYARAGKRFACRGSSRFW